MAILLVFVVDDKVHFNLLSYFLHMRLDINGSLDVKTFNECLFFFSVLYKKLTH